MARTITNKDLWEVRNAYVAATALGGILSSEAVTEGEPTEELLDYIASAVDFIAVSLNAFICFAMEEDKIAQPICKQIPYKERYGAPSEPLPMEIRAAE